MELGDVKYSGDIYGILLERERRLKGYPCLVKTLEALCLCSIKEHFTFFLDYEQSTGMNPFDCLPNSLKTKLLGSYQRKWGNWERLLLNRQVIALNICLNFKADPDASLDLCASLAKEQPKLEKFKWSGQIFNQIEARIPVILITSLPNFVNLQSLELEYFSCNNLHLEMIATHLTKLRSLKLILEAGVTSRGISALSKLENLQKFPFRADSQIYHEEMFKAATMLYNLCIQLLPRLHVIGEYEVILTKLYCYTDLGDKDFRINFQSLQTPLELGLQQMILHNNVGHIPDSITFPNLTTLCLWHPVHNFRLDSRFSKVSDLALLYLGMNKNLGILKILGHQIRKLGILEADEDLQLDLILRLCPNLIELHLGMCPRNVTCTIPLEPDVDLKYLELLRIDSSPDDNDVSPEFAPGVLLQLLMAPNLLKIYFNWVELTKDDAEAIVSLVQQGQILQKLEIFEFQSSYIDENDDDADSLFDQVIRDRLDLILDNMAIYCPRFIRYIENDVYE